MDTPQPDRVTTLPLSRIRPRYNPRRYFDPKKHDELVASFLLRGVLQPIVVRPAADDDGFYDLVAGERRYRAGLEAFGLHGDMPVTIREMTDQEALEAAIDENDVRDDVSETEQADAAVRGLAACHGDRAEAARRLGWSRAKLDRRLALANLADPVKRALDERRIKVGHAELLAAVPPDKQEKALDTILASNLDVGKTRDLLMRVTQNLAGASFDKAECTTCPFNSGTQRALFETHIVEGHCTNPGCFQLKTEAAEVIRFEEQERAEKATRATNPPTPDDPAGDEQDDGAEPSSPSPDIEEPPVNGKSTDHNGTGTSRPPGAVPAASAATSVHKSPVTGKSIATRTADLREAKWRTAVARALAGNAAHAQTTILVAAMSGTLPQIRAETLRARAGLLVDTAFPNLDYGAKIAAIRALPEAQASTVLSAIGAAYARDVGTFEHVAELARAFDVDLRDVWHVDQAFLERFTKDELKFIAQECGLISHMGEKAFARLLGSKKADLIAGMLNRTGFDWAGRLPSAMTLDGQYGPPPNRATPLVEPPLPELAA